jgi:hypothetical protein
MHYSLTALLGRSLGLMVVLGLLALAPAGEVLAQDSGSRVIHEWSDVQKVDGSSVTRLVQIVFDYDAGVTRQLTFDSAGRLMASVDMPGQPAPTDAEVERAIQIIMQDAELGQMALQHQAVIEGGFILEEEAKPGQTVECGLGTRCLQMDIMAGYDMTQSLRMVAVDLVSGRIVYRNHRPH